MMAEAIEDLIDIVIERLGAAPGVTALVPVDRITTAFDEDGVGPCIVTGDASIEYSDNADSFHERVLLTLDVWAGDNDTRRVHAITGAVRRVLSADLPWTGESYAIQSVRLAADVTRDESRPKLAHAAIEIDAIMKGL